MTSLPLLSDYHIRFSLPSPLTFLFLSDLHECRISPLLRWVREKHPDAVLVAGDVVQNENKYENGLLFLRKASAQCPVFLSIGNHDLRLRDDGMQLLRETGAEVLDDRAAGFGGLLLGGLSSGFSQSQSTLDTTPEPDLGFLSHFAAMDGRKLLLCHHPEYYARYIRSLPIDLTLSGHAHGGQWRIFGRGIFAPGQGLFPKYTSGLYDGRLLVSRGLGNPCGIPRFFNPPEGILLTIE